VNESNTRRKIDYMEIALNKNLEINENATGLEDYWFVHQALPEVNLADIDLSISLFGKTLSAPLIISPLVGGVEAATSINRNLAKAAQSLGVAMGVGSQRCAIDNPDMASTYVVRDIAPDILLFANLGAVQLNHGYGISECRRAVEMIGADGLILHLNPLQEALQTDGDTNFAGLLTKIERICRELTVPVVVKEIGTGISEDVARKLASIGVAGIDVAGAGGTTWSEVERHRSNSYLLNNSYSVFKSWGIPLAESIKMTRNGAPKMPLIASGGIRNGIHVAKAIALGTDMAGIAAPMLRAANISAEAVIAALQDVIKTLRICMFCIGTSKLDELRDSCFLKRRTRD